MVVPPKTRQADLDQSVKTLRNLTRDIQSIPGKQAGELFLAALDLLSHLKRDLRLVWQIGGQASSEGGQTKNYPSPENIPAISAVVHDQALFSSLVSCLDCAAGETDVDGGRMLSNNLKAGGLNPNQGRKRAFSVTSSNSEHGDIPGPKMSKLSHSPSVGKRSNPNAKPKMNVRILAATIIFSAFEHLDHWPVTLIKAYANDCFGPRSWVDDPACSLLVQNLSFCHGEGCDNDDLSTGTIGGSQDSGKDAMLVATYFRSKIKDPAKPMKIAKAPSDRALRRGSLSSQASSQNSVNGGFSERRHRSNSFDGRDTESKRSPIQKSKGVKRKLSSKPSGEDDGGSSSSSGEEDNEVAIVSKSNDSQSIKSVGSAEEKPNAVASDLIPLGASRSRELTYPVIQRRICLQRVRQRFFGANLECAHEVISSSLSDRLNVKSKQNSSLLQCLPGFTSVPLVRSLIAGSLSKWLQSPALSGLARQLFVETVNKIKNVDPPLAPDVVAIDDILSMKLKANQLNAHIENVTAIASRVPTPTVSHQIFLHLLRGILISLHATGTPASDLVKMAGAVFRVMPPELAAKGIATALLSLMAGHDDSLVQIEANQITERLRLLICVLAKELGSSFDGQMLLLQLLSSNSAIGTSTAKYEENKARLMLQCVTLMVPTSLIASKTHPSQSGQTQPDRIAFRTSLLRAKKSLLRWCCNDYAGVCDTEKRKSKKGSKKRDDAVGAGEADYSSILDGQKGQKFPAWLLVMRCVLFMEDADSEYMLEFLHLGAHNPSSDSDQRQRELTRLRCCLEVGSDIDDELVWTIIEAASNESAYVVPSAAITLLEHMFESCGRHETCSITVSDPKIIESLFQLVKYNPPPPSNAKQRDESDDDTESEKTSDNEKRPAQSEKFLEMHPQLAYPGLWWRTTGLALIMCGSSPRNFGTAFWDKYPSLRVLLKMMTSDRYRFPTVDCDEVARDKMKKMEQSMRDEEGKIAEMLFLPKAKKKKKEDSVAVPSYGGSRVSRRQQDKRERMLRQQREKEASDALHEANRRKKMLRSAQKTIMIWDPKGPPRKPPRESADLIFAIGEMFGLPKIFQQSVDPDFVMLTIGETTRGAIERAYDWLIPIISIYPKTISRLPASASCFLLLRAYGTEGEERIELEKLSAPLLDHVRDSLLGKFGETDAIRAFDLLLTDVASSNQDRRICSRRVFHDSIGEIEDASSCNPRENGGPWDGSWMSNIIRVEHALSVVVNAIKQLSIAATLSQSKTVHPLILALKDLISFARKNNITEVGTFESLLTELISSRPSVFADSLSSYHDLRSLTVEVISQEMNRYMESPESEIESKTTGTDVFMKIRFPPGDEKAVVKSVVVPLTFLQSASVLLSIWTDDRSEGGKSSSNGKAIEDLVLMLMRPQDYDNTDEAGKDTTSDGLASARIPGSEKNAVSVESWVMLARSRSDFIAKRASMTAPTAFLPRLLLCSGLPRASLLSMIDRLGKLGEKASDVDKVFSNLLVPSAASEWDIGRLGRRKEVLRKLLGRLTAYAKMHNISSSEGTDAISFTFLEWLSEQCRQTTISRKTKSKRKSLSAPNPAQLRRVADVLDKLPSRLGELSRRNKMDIVGDPSTMSAFRSHANAKEKEPLSDSLSIDAVRNDIKLMLRDTDSRRFEQWIGERENARVYGSLRLGVSNATISAILVQCYSQMEEKTKAASQVVSKWAPWLARNSGNPELWRLIFSKQVDGDCSFTWNAILAHCLSSWTPVHISTCQTWLLDRDHAKELNLTRVVRFLVSASKQHSSHCDSFAALSSLRVDPSWGASEAFVGTATKIAIQCMIQDDDEEQGVRNRNGLPDWLFLLLLLAQCGKKQVQYVSQTVAQRIDAVDARVRPILLAVVLRLYAYHPQSMNLGVVKMRNILKEAVETYSKEWLLWRSPMDDQFHDMLILLASGGAPARVIQSLVDGSKKHPLLLLRQLNFIVDALENDAIACEYSPAKEERGVVFGYSTSDARSAKMYGKTVMVTIKHWGFNYSEYLWETVLDIVSMVPREVLFACGLKMGLLDLLDAYVRLLIVQSDLRVDERLSKLKEKILGFLGAFKQSNNSGWGTWLSTESTTLPSIGRVRNLLVSCSLISEQEAIENVKANAKRDAE